MTKLNTMTDENPINETQQSGDSAASQGGDANGAAFEPLTASYERLRHSTDSAELSEFARRPLPDRSDQAAFSRATALLEAVAGNKHTPVEDRVFLASTMPFPNVLVKLSVDPEPSVRVAVAANEDELAGRASDQGSDSRGEGCRAAQQAHQLEDAARGCAGSRCGQ